LSITPIISNSPNARAPNGCAAGADHAEMIKVDGLIFVVKSLSIAYHKPAKLDDALEVHTSINKLGNASLVLQQNVLRDGVIITESEVVLVSINKAGKPCRIPENVRGKIG